VRELKLDLPKIKSGDLKLFLAWGNLSALFAVELLVGLGSTRVMPDLSLSHSSLHSPSSHR
jgi:hypothetical protein